MANSKTRINLRTKQIDGGKSSIYLDFYRNGKRVREFLSLYLLPETSAKNIASNKKTMKQAQAIQAQRLQELVVTENNIEIEETKPEQTFPEVKLMDWLRGFEKSFIEKGQKSNRDNAHILINIIKKYSGTRTLLSQIDAAYYDKLVDFMRTGYVTQFGRSLSMTTARVQIYLFSRALNEAVKEGLMKYNPIVDVKVHDRITREKPPKESLTTDEVKILMETRCPVLGRPQVKQAFMLAIFTGLTREDLRNLTWKDIVTEDGQMMVLSAKRNVKVPMSDIAKRWLPVTANKRGVVFKGLPQITETSNVLQKWKKASGINKSLTFTVARNTFVNLLLNTGADTETVCALTGVSQKQLRQYKASSDYCPSSPQEQLEDYYYSVYKRTDI
jgi:Site-specific recombinase XerD